MIRSETHLTILTIAACLIMTSQSIQADQYSAIPAALKNYDVSKHISINSVAEAKKTRQKVIAYFWKDGKLPLKKLAKYKQVYKKGQSLPKDLKDIDVSNVSKVFRFDIAMDFDFNVHSYLLMPKGRISKSRLCVVHQGHQGELVDGIAPLANTLLKKNLAVILMQMPATGWNTDRTFKLPDEEEMALASGRWSTIGHNDMFKKVEGKNGSAFRFFIEPIVVSINTFLKQVPRCRNITMIGLSGGGWTTHVAAAVDKRITLSIPVAGSYPLFMRKAFRSDGDSEQIWPALYKERASWLDLYILAGHGRGRKQIQLLNQFDSCCFWGIGSQIYAGEVRKRMKKLRSGSWSVQLDTSHRHHQISKWAIDNVIVPALK